MLSLADEHHFRLVFVEEGCVDRLECDEESKLDSEISGWTDNFFTIQPDCKCCDEGAIGDE